MAASSATPAPLPTTPAPPSPTLGVTEALREAIIPLASTAGDYAPLCEWIGDATIVLLGEATHGTHEFAKARAEITKRLIVEHGFTAVAIDGDCHAAHRAHRFIQSEGSDQEATDALADFHGFPAWAWRNADTLDFLGWLRTYNNSPTHPVKTKIGLYGLDLFHYHATVGHLLDFLRRSDHPENAECAHHAQLHYSAFEHFAPFATAIEAAQSPGSTPQGPLGSDWPGTSLALPPALEKEALAHLLTRFRPRLVPPFLAAADGTHESALTALHTHAPPYYRAMLRERLAFWNLRDRTMADALDLLLHHLHQPQQPQSQESNAHPGEATVPNHPPKVVLWAHNSHLGDSRATELGAAGEQSLGQLIRERHSAETFLVGLTTHHGTLTTASHWGGPTERKELLPAQAGSVEALFHQLEAPHFLLDLQSEEAAELLQEPLLERAIGAIYQPATERESHYFQVRLAEQFDAVVHFDETRAVEPLENR